MGIKPDKMSYTSDYFDELFQFGVQIITEGNAYADDTDKETMASQRMNGEPSKRRDATVEFPPPAAHLSPQAQPPSFDRVRH